MAKGLSIHIGLNGVDPNAYGGWAGTLAGCVNDAQSMQQIAQTGGYQTKTILNQQATCANVVAAINGAAGMLQSGDILLLTYSGHGGQTPDKTGQEATGMNSTWVLYDRQVIDDELYALWAHFPAGVRIFVLSDSCHSGTVTREAQYAYALAGNQQLSRDYGSRAQSVRYRNMPLDVNQKDYHNRQLMYDTIGTYTPKDVDVRATVLLISGCQDNQLSADGTNNGLFTEKLLQVWNRGGFKGSYSAFRQAIVALMPPTQCPNYYVVGAPNTAFEGQQPFSVTSPGTGQAGGTGQTGNTGGTTTQPGTGSQPGGTSTGTGSWGTGQPGDTGQQPGGGGADSGAGGDSGTGDSGWSDSGSGGDSGSGDSGWSDSGSGGDSGGGDSGWGGADSGWSDSGQG